MMKKVSIIAVAVFALIAIGYLVYSNFIQPSNPCASIFDQTTASLEEQIRILREKGGVILGRDQIQKLSDQSDRITADLKTCCILFHDDKIDFNEFLKCQDDFNHYKGDINRLAHLVTEAQAAKQQERYDLVNLRLSHIERNIRDLEAISEQLQGQIKLLMARTSGKDLKPGRMTPKSIITESEPNDSLKTGMEITAGSLTGTLSADDHQDYFRFELGAADILNLDFTAGEDSENLQIALRGFEGGELWNSGETAPGGLKSTRMMMNNVSGGIYYAVVYSGVGSYELVLSIEPQNDAGSGTDAGDRITKALAIKPGSSYLGEMGGFDEDDWYRFDVQPGHILKLAFSPGETSEAMKFSLRSFESSEVWYSGVVSAGETKTRRVMMNNSSGGTYYLEAYYGSGQYKFEIFSESQNDADSGTDAGDKIAEAYKVTLGRSYSGELGGYDENDCYRFDVPSGSVLKMTFTNDEDGQPMRYAFRNVDGVEVWSSEDVMPGATQTKHMMINNTTGGIYFLEVFHGSGAYKFEIFSEKQNDAGLGTDAGDRMAEATKVLPERVINGELGDLDPEDWYMFSLGEGKAIEFTSDSDGEPLMLSMGSVSNRTVLYTAELTPGLTRTFEVPRDVRPPYFLKVYGGRSQYSFEIK